MDFEAEVYRRAALERLDLTARLYESAEKGEGDYVSIYYLAGVAVECILHAYRRQLKEGWDAGHNLRQLAEEAGFVARMPASVQGEVNSALADVMTRWANNHRYRSLDSLRRFLNDAGLYVIDGKQTVRGDVVAYNAAAIVDGARTLVTLGDRRWKSSSVD